MTYVSLDERILLPDKKTQYLYIFDLSVSNLYMKVNYLLVCITLIKELPLKYFLS